MSTYRKLLIIFVSLFYPVVAISQNVQFLDLYPKTYSSSIPFNNSWFGGNVRDYSRNFSRNVVITSGIHTNDTISNNLQFASFGFTISNRLKVYYSKGYAYKVKGSTQDSLTYKSQKNDKIQFVIRPIASKRFYVGLEINNNIYSDYDKPIINYGAVFLPKSNIALFSYIQSPSIQYIENDTIMHTLPYVQTGVMVDFGNNLTVGINTNRSYTWNPRWKYHLYIKPLGYYSDSIANLFLVGLTYEKISPFFDVTDSIISEKLNGVITSSIDISRYTISLQISISNHLNATNGYFLTFSTGSMQ